MWIHPSRFANSWFHTKILPRDPGTYMRQTPTSASESEDLAIFSIRSLTHLVAPAETVLPYQALYKQKGKDRLSDKNVVERRSDAQRCREMAGQWSLLNRRWITPKPVFSSVMIAPDLFSLSTKTPDKMPSTKAQIIEAERSLCLHHEMTASSRFVPRFLFLYAKSQWTIAASPFSDVLSENKNYVSFHEVVFRNDVYNQRKEKLLGCPKDYSGRHPTMPALIFWTISISLSCLITEWAQELLKQWEDGDEWHSGMSSPSYIMLIGYCHHYSSGAKSVWC